jgi:hypothetical protein
VLPPSEVGVVHMRPTMPEAVTVASFYKLRGAAGADAARIETSFDAVRLSPKAFLDTTVNF